MIFLGHTSLILAQQGQFTRFAGIYCCAIPLGMAAALLGVYFSVRWYARKHEDR